MKRRSATFGGSGGINHLKKYGEYEKRLYTEEHSNLYYNYDWDALVIMMLKIDDFDIYDSAFFLGYTAFFTRADSLRKISCLLFSWTF